MNPLLSNQMNICQPISMQQISLRFKSNPYYSIAKITPHSAQRKVCGILGYGLTETAHCPLDKSIKLKYVFLDLNDKRSNAIRKFCHAIFPSSLVVKITVLIFR